MRRGVTVGYSGKMRSFNCYWIARRSCDVTGVRVCKAVWVDGCMSVCVKDCSTSRERVVMTCRTHLR